MAIQVVTEFIAKATVRTIAYVYNDAGSLTEPDSVKISIWDPDGGDPAVDGVEIVVDGKVEDGVYEYYYPTDVDTVKGWWRGQIEVVDGTGEGARTSMGNFSFRIK